jgi:hypothetical protein
VGRAVTARGTIFLLLASVLLFGADCNAQAQTETVAPAQAHQQLGREQLDQLVAPIALYPDNLLSEILMASTYPLEVVQAERWLKANKGLKGDKLKDAVDKQPWDDSVKSLIATPSVLDMLSSKIDWTQTLGRAVIDQQAEVMDAVQRLRAKAQANNKLQSGEQQKVVVRQEQGRQVITIEPTDPSTIYVPYYDPGVVYGDWPYPEYPPYYWPAPGYIGAGVIATGIAFGAGYALGRWASGAYWRGNVNWNNRNIAINRPGGGNTVGNNSNRGAHAEQRLGNRGGRQQGLNFRGSNGQRVVKPGGRGNGGQRQNLGNPGGGRNQVANRPAHNGRSDISTRGGRAGHAANLGGRGRAGHAPGGGSMRRAGGGMHGHRGGGMHAMGEMRGGGYRGGGGGGGRGGRGGGRRSDIRLKHDIALLGYLDNGLGFYRFSYNGGTKAYVGVIAQEVQQRAPMAVARGPDGYLRVDYRKLGLKFESYDHWIRSGARVPEATPGE